MGTAQELLDRCLSIIAEGFDKNDVGTVGLTLVTLSVTEVAPTLGEVEHLAGLYGQDIFTCLRKSWPLTGKPGSNS